MPDDFDAEPVPEDVAAFIDSIENCESENGDYLEPDWARKAQLIEDGSFDDAFIAIDHFRYNVESGDYLLPLNQIQLDRIFPDKMSKYKKERLYETKQITKKTNENAEKLILEAIDKQVGIRFTYQNALGEKTQGLMCNPSHIRQNAQNNILYCFNDKNHIFRIDRMENIHLLTKKVSDDGSIKYNDDFDHLWALPDNDPTLYHVKCIIRPKRMRNLINKIKSDLRRRKSAVFTELENGTYLYEDDITGMSGFIPWVRSYGSTIEVLEVTSENAPEGRRDPDWLARQLYEEALKKINLF